MTKFFLITILLLGFGVRLYRITRPVADWHSWRQADTASIARIYKNEGFNLLHPRYYDISTAQTGRDNPKGYRFVEFPIYNSIHYVFIRLLPSLDIDMLGRLVSVFASLFSCLFLYFISLKIYGRVVAILSSFFLTFLPFNVFFSTTILPESLAIMFGLLAILLFQIFVEKKSYFHFYLSSVFLSLGILTKPFIIFYAPVLIYLFVKNMSKFSMRFDGLKSVVSSRQKGFLMRLVVFVSIVLLPFLVWRLWMSNFPEGIPDIKWAFNGDKIRFKPSFWRWIFAERIGILILGVWGLPIFVLGLLKDQKHNFSRAFFASMLLYLAIFATSNVRHDYYQVMIVPSLSLTLAIGCIALFKGVGSVFWSRIILGFCLIVTFIVSWTDAREFYKVNHPEIVAAGSFIRSYTPKDSLIIASYNKDTAFLYQTERFGWPFIDGSIGSMIEKGADYYASVNLEDPTTKLVEATYQIVNKTEGFVVVKLIPRI